MTPEADKLARLREILKGVRSAVLAYSGGVDSAFLLKAAADVLKGDLLAVTAVSPTYPQEEHDQACAIARALGVRHISIVTHELEDSRFSANPPDRCYYCKKELFARLREIADRERKRFVMDASNVDDCSDYRPGRRAAEEAGVRSPLVEAGFTKDDIRGLSREMGLATWDKPSLACLASRFPYGETVTPEKLRRVDQAERVIKNAGFKQVRVRSHGNLARIEVEPDGVPQLAEPARREKVIEELKKLGFTYVALDLQGYRTGSLNEDLKDGRAPG